MTSKRSEKEIFVKLTKDNSYSVRFTVPLAIRQALALKAGDIMSAKLESTKLILEKVRVNE